jgi:hypothetical protein
MMKRKFKGDGLKISEALYGRRKDTSGQVSMDLVGKREDNNTDPQPSSPIFGETSQDAIYPNQGTSLDKKRMANDK